jgi:hypothetical protein
MHHDEDHIIVENFHGTKAFLIKCVKKLIFDFCIMKIFHYTVCTLMCVMYV